MSVNVSYVLILREELGCEATSFFLTHGLPFWTFETSNVIPMIL